MGPDGGSGGQGGDVILEPLDSRSDFLFAFRALSAGRRPLNPFVRKTFTLFGGRVPLPKLTKPKKLAPTYSNLSSLEDLEEYQGQQKLEGLQPWAGVVTFGAPDVRHVRNIRQQKGIAERRAERLR